MSERRSLAESQRRLAILWFVGAGAIFLLVLTLTIRGMYGDQSEKAWAWFAQTVTPTLSLIARVLIAQTKQAEDTALTVSSISFQLCWYLSIAYLLLVLLTPLAQPLTDTANPLDFFSASAAWLTPVQALVGLTLGVFFVSRGPAK